MASNMASAVNMVREIVRMFGYFLLFLHFGYEHMADGFLQEYCSSDIFSPRCGEQEVIVMKEAVYGRMHRGKCMTSDIGLGCQKDVLQIFDEKCSNKNNCQVNAFMELHSLETPCPPEIVRFLEADYICEQVLQIQSSECRSPSNRIEVSSKVSVSSDTLASTNCGSSSLNFIARPGQQLNITIIDFNRDDAEQHGGSSRPCANYLELIDSGKSEAICAGSYGRHGHVMLSSSHDITAVFHVQDPRNQRFIISFEAVGCGDITPQEGTLVQRDGDETTLSCRSGRHSWTLTCEHNQWVGAVGSCGTFITVNETEQPQAKQKWNLALGMVVFAIFSVLLFMCSTTFSIGVCVYTKRNENEPHRPSTRYHQQTLPLIAHSRHQPAANTPTNQVFIEQQQFIQQRDRQNPSSGNTTGQKALHNESGADSHQMYCNTNTMQSQSDSMYSDPVKYYVLENTRESNSIPVST